MYLGCHIQKIGLLEEFPLGNFIMHIILLFLKSAGLGGLLEGE